MNEDRKIVFIDGSGLFHSWKESHRMDKKTLPRLERVISMAVKSEYFRAYYYATIADGRSVDGELIREKQRKFLYSISQIEGVEVRLGKLMEKRDGSHVEKGVDVMLAVDMVSMAYRNMYSTAILIAGDADFTYAVEEVKNTGRRVEVAFYENALAADLAMACDVRRLLEF